SVDLHDARAAHHGRLLLACGKALSLAPVNVHAGKLFAILVKDGHLPVVVFASLVLSQSALAFSPFYGFSHEFCSPWTIAPAPPGGERPKPGGELPRGSSPVIPSGFGRLPEECAHAPGFADRDRIPIEPAPPQEKMGSYMERDLPRMQSPGRARRQNHLAGNTAGDISGFCWPCARRRPLRHPARPAEHPDQCSRRPFLGPSGRTA